MAKLNKYRRRWLRWHKQYEKRALKPLDQTFKTWGKAIDFDKLNYFNYDQLIDEAIDTKLLEESLYLIYTNIGLVHGKRIGAEFNKTTKFFELNNFNSSYISVILDWLREHGADNIKTIANTFKRTIVRIISNGFQEGLGIEEIARNLQRTVNQRGFYRYQARRIARTEATSAANKAALHAGEITGFVTNKIWISASDARTRRFPKAKFDHFDMHLKQVGLKENFKVPMRGLIPMKGYEELSYPGDKFRGSAGNIINCRCSVSIIAARDKDGNLIRT